MSKPLALLGQREQRRVRDPLPERLLKYLRNSTEGNTDAAQNPAVAPGEIT
jgi:hypothetical protein